MAEVSQIWDLYTHICKSRDARSSVNPKHNKPKRKNHTEAHHNPTVETNAKEKEI